MLKARFYLAYRQCRGGQLLVCFEFNAQEAVRAPGKAGAETNAKANLRRTNKPNAYGNRKGAQDSRLRSERQNESRGNKAQNRSKESAQSKAIMPVRTKPAGYYMAGSSSCRLCTDLFVLSAEYSSSRRCLASVKASAASLRRPSVFKERPLSIKPSISPQ